MVIIKFFSILAEITGFRELEIPLTNDIMIEDLITIIFSKTNEKFRNYIANSDGSLKDFITIVLNEKILSKEDIISKKIVNDDIVAFLTPIEGG
ncbi:MAG: MoaD/ThiS family protein [Candidatus Helarchaeota archaeon]